MKQPETPADRLAPPNAPAGVFSTVKTPLLNAMAHYQDLDRSRFHVPGHNGQPLILSTLPPGFAGFSPNNFAYDLTELEGLDVLSEPESCLLEAQAEMAKAVGVANSFFLVNGSSVGLMAGLLSVLKPNDKVMLARNIHCAVISGLILTGAKPVWVLPDALENWGLWSVLSAESVETAFKANPACKALVITSPTYEGIGSNIVELLAVCRRYKSLLIVDEAHGSLWPFVSGLPASACAAGCDLVIHSMHKSAGSLTQSAVAHLPIGSMIPHAQFQQALNTLQTTSPSYLLLASLEAARVFLQSPAGQRQCEFLLAQTDGLRHQFKENLHDFQLFEPSKQSAWDPTRLWISHRQYPASQWAPAIEAFASIDIEANNNPRPIAYENATAQGALYISGLGLQASDYQQFLNTFQYWQAKLKHTQNPQPPDIDHSNNLSLPLQFDIPEIAMSPREAFFSPGKTVNPQAAIGSVAKETIVHCPPGIAVLIPGERISEKHLPFLNRPVQVVSSENKPV